MRNARRRAGTSSGHGMKPCLKKLRFLVPAAATALLIFAWTRSYFRRDSLSFEAGKRSYIISSIRGRIGVVQSSYMYDRAWPDWASYHIDRVPGGTVTVI